ncbi:MAG: hypothetical protein AAFV95_25010 [Bacteroidota bacterium]
MKLTATHQANFPKPVFVLCLLALLCFAHASHGQNIITFPIGSTSPTHSDPGISFVSNLSPGPGITVVNCPPWLSATGWNYLFASDALQNGQYWEFYIDVAQGYELNISSIEVVSRASDTTYSRVAGQWYHETESAPGTWLESSYSSSMQGVGRDDICLLGARSRTFPISINTAGRIRLRLVHFRANQNQTRFGAINISGSLLQVLPVELIRFEAKAQDDDIQLEWETASEIENEGFEVQRLDGDLNWQIIGWVDGQGSTNEATRYRFQDDFPQTGDNLYRLKQIDHDGSHSFSKIVQASHQKEQPIIQVFPNPSQGPVEVRLRNPNKEKMSLQLYDGFGRMAWQSGIMTELDSWRRDFDLRPGCQYFLLIQIGASQYHRHLLIQSTD